MPRTFRFLHTPVPGILELRNFIIIYTPLVHNHTNLLKRRAPGESVIYYQDVLPAEEHAVVPGPQHLSIHLHTRKIGNHE